MTGRARATSRGRVHGQETSAPSQTQQPPAPSPSAEGKLVVRDRQKTQGPSSEEAVSQISAGFPLVFLGERGRNCRVLHDMGINTRQAMEHVKESKTGTSGAVIHLTANFFRIQPRPMWVLYQYHVDFKPAMESRRLRSALLFQNEDILGPAKSFDGALLFLPHRLHSKKTVLYSETRNEEKVQITITLINKLPPSSPGCIQFYNIIFRRICRFLHMQQIGRNYYNPSDPINIPHRNLTIWPGYATTILRYESHVMMCTDVSHKVLRSKTVLDFMVKLREQCGGQIYTDVCTKELVGLTVLTKYNNKTYRIDDIAWDQTPNNTFKRGDTDISFKSYYKSQYGLDITDGNQVLLVSHVKRRRVPGATPPGPAMLVPELCYLTGLTDKMRRDFTIMKDLSVHTTLNPAQREKRLSGFMTTVQKHRCQTPVLEDLSLTPQVSVIRNADVREELAKWGLSFDKQLLKLTGRVLGGEKMFQGSRSYECNPLLADWSREMDGIPLISCPPLNDWLIFHTKENFTEVQSLLQSLYKVSGPFGICIQRPIVIEFEDRQLSLLEALRHNVEPETQMVVVILPNNSKDKYDSVKKYLCVDCPTPSQCVLASTLRQANPFSNAPMKIMLQMACKMGGELWTVEIPLKQLMIIGIDCYHDTATGKRSVGALVASLNSTMSKWYSKCVLQQRGQEIMDGLKAAFNGALKNYHRFNNCLPSRIIVYRDGVEDGQLLSVFNYEVSQIKESFENFKQNYTPKLSVVVVKKRNNSRFFTLDGGKVANPPQGTVIDKEVTRPEWYDFYIVSQSVRYRSASPTHYNVVYDTNRLKPDHMQRLTYKMCHMYYNWQGTINVPAPCQYAHKLAYLVGESIHTEPNGQLENCLFYL